MTCGRFAPTPSGRMHLGNVFCAVLAWLSARSQNGGFVLRFEDLDTRARDPLSAALIEQDLSWLGIDWDYDPVFQSRRLEVYEEALVRLEDAARVYPCFCTRTELHAASAPHASDGTPVYPGTCRHLDDEQVRRRLIERSAAQRLEVDDADITFMDGHYGPFSQNLARECGDFLVRRSDGVFAYQLSVVVDDAAAGVDEVVRGRDLMSSTPRQILLQRLLGYETPSYYHHPMLLAADGRRLSKRERDCDMGKLRDRFHRPENLLGLIGKLAGLIDSKEPVTLEELIGEFSWDKVPCEDILIGSTFNSTGEGNGR